MHKKILPVLFSLLCLFIFEGCAQTTVAFLDASVTASGDTSGAQSSRVRVNFTNFVGSKQGDNLKLSFSNPEGDTLDFVVAPQNGSFPVASYDIDGKSANAFSAKVTVISNLTPQTLTLTSSNGFVNILAINISDGTLVSVGGNFKVNIDGGGAAEGTFNTASN